MLRDIFDKFIRLSVISMPLLITQHNQNNTIIMPKYLGPILPKWSNFNQSMDA